MGEQKQQDALRAEARSLAMLSAKLKANEEGLRGLKYFKAMMREACGVLIFWALCILAMYSMPLAEILEQLSFGEPAQLRFGGPSQPRPVPAPGPPPTELMTSG